MPQRPGTFALRVLWSSKEGSSIFAFGHKAATNALQEMIYYDYTIAGPYAGS